MARAIAFKTYWLFAEKYGIPLKYPCGCKKPIKELSKEIYAYEMQHSESIENGLYVNIPTDPNFKLDISG